MATKKDTKKTGSIFSDFSPIRDILLQFVGSFFRNFIEQLQENITERIEEVQADLKVKAALFVKKAIQAFVVFFLLTLGGIFLFFGLANILDYIFKIDGVGFLLVGVVMTFFGLIIAVISIKQKIINLRIKYKKMEKKVDKQSKVQEKSLKDVDVLDLAKKEMKNAEKKINKLKSDVKDEAQDLRDKATNELKKLKKDVEKGAKKVQDYAKENPKKAAAISAGVGAALGASLAVLFKKKKKADKKKKK